MKKNDSQLKTGLADNIMDKLCLTPAAVAGIVLLLVIPYVPPFNQEYMIRWLVAAALSGLRHQRSASSRRLCQTSVSQLIDPT